MVAVSTALLDLKSLRIDGQDAAGSYADVLDALESLTIKETITGASTVEMTLHDPHRKLLRSGLLSQGSGVGIDPTTGGPKAGSKGLNGATMILDGAGFELCAIRKSGSSLSLTWEDMAVAALRRKTGQKVVAAGQMTRAEFCASLIREIPWIKVAYAPGAKSLEQLARGSTTTALTATGGGAGGWGGLPGASANVVDGDSIKDDGERHPLSSASSYSSALKATVPETIPGAAAALAKTDLGGITAADKKNLEDSWTAIGRIMGAIGWRAYVHRGVVYLGPDQWLMNRSPAKYTFTEPIPGETVSSTGVDSIDLDWDVGKPAATATLGVWAQKSDLLPGSPITLTGMGPGDGTWLIESIERAVGTKKATVTAIRPSPGLAEPQNTSSTGVGDQGEGGWGTPLASDATSASGERHPLSAAAGGKAEQFVQAALTAKGKPYVWGAHGPNAFDCSNLVAWAASKVGVSCPAPVGTQVAICQKAGTIISVQQAIATSGALLFRGGEHVAISLGNGYTMEARGKAYGCGIFSATKGRAWTSGGLIPGIGR